MAPTVLGTVASTRTQRVLLTLEELGIEYDFKVVDLSKGQHHNPEYVRDHHPFAKVPVFQDDGIEIFESRAIARYLAVKQKSHLAPPSDDPEALAAFEQAASVEYAYFEPAVSALGFELIFKKMFNLGNTDQAIVDQQKALLNTTLDYYEKKLEAQQYLAGKDYSLVDLFHVPWLGFIRNRLQLGELIDSRKNVAAWAERISQRDASKAVSAKAVQH
ncbi:glutathione S-transferase [Fusarium redolens]|uniref:glutathione transferase n=1 Tax=Fusarium redolens TaxID=48865 RepID=A0A9P9G941_FUSRE|nr:glutathione S-transferase [Fusarium redolens]KAH7234621.1 glutathione S-transferase [Fusarium redolens]